MLGRRHLMRALALALLAGVLAVWCALPPQEAGAPPLIERGSPTPAANPEAAGASDAPADAERAHEVVASDEAAGGPLLRGEVRDDSGRAVREFRLHLRPVRGTQASLDVRGGSGREFSVPDGRFELAGLAPGRWIATAQSGARSASQEFELALDDVSLVFILPLPARIAGRVEDPHGRPSAGAELCLRLRGRPGTYLLPSALTTDAEGRFALEDVPQGELLLEAAAPTFARSERLELWIAAGEELSDLRLALRRPARIVGRACDDQGRPDSGRELALTGSFGCGAELAPHPRTDAEGRFEFGGLAPGEYRLQRVPRPEEQAARASSPEHDRFLARLATGVRIELREGETIELALGAPQPQGVRLWGFVIDATSSAGPLSVELDALAPGAARRFTAVDERGGYELLLDAGGEHTLRVEGSDGTLLAREVTLPASGALRLDLELDTAAVRGTVFDAAGAPLAQAELSLAPRRGADVELRTRPRHDETDAEGRFAFERVEAGTYTLLARPAAARRDASSGLAAARIEELVVAPGARIEALELHLPLAGAIEVEVVGPGGPLAGVELLTADADGRASEARPARATDARGTTRIEGLAPGTWSVRALHAELAGAWSQPLEVPAGGTAHARLELVAGLSVHVQVRGVRAPGAWVRVLDGRGLELARAWSRALDPLEQRAPLTLGPLPPGRFSLRVEEPQGRAASLPIMIDSVSTEPIVVDLDG